ncbi:MAG: hypothetical protein IT456_11090 [Planctomycetes bacterium]|nr:hypothetical protein [Planctomycetota bacterium]
MAAVIEANVPVTARVISGVVRTYSHDVDTLVMLDHVVKNDLGLDQRPCALNGRASLVLEDPGLRIVSEHGEGQEWLTQEVVGLLPFTDGVLDFLPSPSWQEQLSWEADPRDPLVWSRDGRRVAWFERFFGPPRDVWPGDFVHRQPVLGRWVCAVEEWQRIAEIMGKPIRRTREKLGRIVKH